MIWDEYRVRTVILAQAVETQDRDRQLVTQRELDDAGASAVAAARARGIARPEVADIVVERAQAMVAAAAARNRVVGAIAAAPGWLRALPVALPLVSFMLGFASDRIVNPHRVDLLSPPLLAILGWNLVIYVYLAARAVLAPGQPAPLFLAARQWLRELRDKRRGVGFNAASSFYTLWHAASTALVGSRVARVLHLCAAAWAAGFALSLLARGLIARYQFGWESTFLTAEHVHGIVSAMFWPLTALFGLAPFTLDDIRASQDFPQAGAAGGTWVLMYAGLLALVVVIPRLALAGWARWREYTLGRQLAVDLEAPYFERLKELLWGEIRVVLVFGSQEQAGGMRSILLGQGVVADGAGFSSSAGDSIAFVVQEVAGAGREQGDPHRTAGEVDVVLRFDSAVVPATWKGHTQALQSWDQFGESWVQEGTMFNALSAALPLRQPALSRLKDAWVQRNMDRFTAAMALVAQHLGESAAQVESDEFALRYDASSRTLGSKLLALHGLGADAAPIQSRSMELALQGRPGLPAHLSRGAGAAAGLTAGAAAGATAGAAFDLAAIGTTLGAATAVGGLIGSMAAWVFRARWKKDRSEEILQRITEAAITSYLVTAHLARPRGASSPQPQWKSETEGVVVARWPEFNSAIQSQAGHEESLAKLLEAAVLGILERQFLKR